MRSTTARSRRIGRTGRRRRTVALLAGLGVFAFAFINAPTALADTANPASADRVNVSVEPAAVEPITIADLRQMVEEFTASGEITLGGSWRLNATLSLAEFYFDLGYPPRAIHALELFREVASDPTRVLTENARDALIAGADQLIAQISGT